MKVCHLVTSTLNTHYFANLCGGLSERGISLLGVTLHDPLPPEWLIKGNGQYRCLNAKGKLQLPFAALALAKILRREKIELLQTHLYEAGIVGILAARLAGVQKIILTRHHSDQVHLIGKPWHISLDRWMARQADHVVVLSQAVRNFMIQADRIEGDKIEVIYQGFDFVKFNATDIDRLRIRSEFSLNDDFVVGTIGHLFHTKGHRYLFQAIKTLIPIIPNIQVLLLGEGDRSYISNLAQEAGIAERVILAGHRCDVPACIKAMDLVVHPSLSEAFCQVLIETMSVGTPLVATDVGGATEVIAQGQTGMLVPSQNSHAIAALPTS
jgi:glycosyltransferase involved in cell wall biosynthesis